MNTHVSGLMMAKPIHGQRGMEGGGGVDLSVGGLGKGHDCRVGLKESPHWREEAQICVKQLLLGRDCRSDSERETMN